MAIPLKKIKFLLSKTVGINSLLRLMIHSRMYSRSKQLVWQDVKDDLPVKYNMLFGEEKVPVYMRTYAGDIAIFYEIFYKKIYEPSLDTVTVKTILDIGANIGMASLYFRELYPAAKVIAVEPDHSNFRLLQKNLSTAIREKKVIAIQAAVAGHEGIIGFNSSYPKYNSKIADEADIGYEVTAVTINSIIEKLQINSIDILKMDIEGGESLVFGGDLSWIEWVKYLIIEFHNEGDKATILELLNRHGFKIEGCAGMLYKLQKKR